MAALLLIAFTGALIVSLYTFRNRRWIMLFTALAIAVFPTYNQAMHNALGDVSSFRLDLFIVAPLMLAMIVFTMRISWAIFTEKE